MTMQDMPYIRSAATAASFVSTESHAPGPAGGAARKPATSRIASPQERRMAFIIGGILLLIAAVVTPFANIPLLPVAGFLVAYSTGLFFLDILVFVLLLSKARIEGNRGHMMLATAYLFAGCIIIPHLASFPDVLVPGMLIGFTGSAIWLWVFWHGGFAALIAGYALGAKPTLQAGKPRVLAPVLSAVMLAALATVLATTHVVPLPNILQGGQYMSAGCGPLVRDMVLALTVAATLAIGTKFRLRTAEDLWLTVGMVGACADVWLTLSAGHRYSLGWYCGRVCGISTVFVLFTSLLNDVLMTYQSVSAANTVLDKMTLTDALTSLGNRRMFDDVLEREWRRCRRDNAALTIVMVDVDEFKTYNDTYGHQAGDACLQKIAAQLQASAARPGDMAMRYGGEEFALILPATDGGGGEYLARRVRLRVRDLAIPHISSHHKVITISAGVASLVPSDSFGSYELVRLADVALYRAKASGRDSVVVAG